MEHVFNLLEKSQRLRYEAFSVFAAGVNKAETIEKIGQQLTSQLKFILDIFLVRIYYSFEGKNLVFEVSKGQCSIREVLDNTTEEDTFHRYEEELLNKLLPMYLSRDEVEQHPLLADCLFHHPRLKSYFALPILISPSHHIVISTGNKEDSLYGEVDFRFLRLIGDLLSSKLSQLLLLESIESKNRQLKQANTNLEEANEKLLVLNQEIQGLNATLEKKVEERTKELKKTNQELHTIFYRTSHDFRRPLTSILGLTQLAELTTSDSSAVQVFSHMKNVVSEMGAMLSKLSILSTADSRDLNVELINFEEIYAEIKNKLGGKIQESNIVISCTFEENLCFYSDWAMMNSILENLIENAIYFHRVLPNQSSSYVNIDIKKNSNEEQSFLQICIEDNGQGIEEAHLDNIFEIYYRANEHSKGNGLGLYVVKKLVTLLKGDIMVTSKLAYGTTFTILLPL